jgi:hypothetical protein
VVPLRESIPAPAQPDHNPAAGFSELMLSFYDSSFGPRFCDWIFSLVSMTTVRTLILKLWLLAYFPYFEKMKVG